jgi:hypothetical protein
MSWRVYSLLVALMVLLVIGYAHTLKKTNAMQRRTISTAADVLAC